jgi:hypothetical protein
VFAFRKEQQKTGESVVEFHTRLQILSKKRCFQDNNVEIRRQIIQGTTSTRLRHKAMEQSLTLENLLKTARSMESADEHSQEMERQTSNAVNRKPLTNPPKVHKYRNSQPHAKKNKKRKTMPVV